jgi:hypothetical protein
MLSIDSQNKSNFRKKKLKTVKNMYLVRKKHPNKDKENNWVETFEQALTLIGQIKVKQSVSWLNYIDYFFEGTDDYIREKVS